MPDISDGELVLLARDGDPVAFRLLVERHQPMVRARAGQLCANPSDTDDVMQETFLRAFIALDQLRDPDRIAAWLAGITANVCHGLRRRREPALVPDWPEPLHPTANDGVPSADDIDRADAVCAAMAELPAGQRRSVVLRYYADVEAGTGAARASLYKARRRMRAYLTERRPDLVPATARRQLMTTVRIARAARRDRMSHLPARAPTHVALLADEAGGRELPLWFLTPDGFRLERLLGAEREQTTDGLTARILRALGASVTGVEIGELGPEVAAARIGLTSSAGVRQVTVRLVDGLAIAIAADAPIRVADTVMDRLAVPAGTTPLRGVGPGGAPVKAALRPREPVPRRPGRPRYSPRNATFADGFDGWLFGGSFAENVSDSHWHDYECVAKDGTAMIASAVPEPSGFAMLGQEIYADDYQGSMVVFRGEFRVPEGRAGLFLRVNEGRPIRGPLTEQAAFADPDNNVTPVANEPEWASHQVSARVPADVDAVVFGIFLAGPGRIELRNPELRLA
jgi:RNA polymerase sigma-70 factor (ECF subfamily)